MPYFIFMEFLDSLQQKPGTKVPCWTGTGHNNAGAGVAGMIRLKCLLDGLIASEIPSLTDLC